MPIYEYRCGGCGHTFEELQQISDPAPEQCPECGHDEVGRLVSQSNFQLRGGGWFADDYGGDSSSTVADDSSGSTSQTAGDGDDAASTTDSSTADSSTNATPEAAAE